MIDIKITVFDAIYVLRHGGSTEAFKDEVCKKLLVMFNEAPPCPGCGHKMYVHESTGGFGFFVVCPHCNKQGPCREKKSQALEDFLETYKI